MKKVFSILIISSAFFAANAQKDLFQNQLKIYQSAIKYNDYNTAINALYEAQVLKPNRTDLRDTLCMVYFSAERYVQAYLLSQDILKATPENTTILEISATSKNILGLGKEALEDFEKLQKAKPQLYFQYQIATLQYQLKRIGECLVTLDKIITNENSATESVSISLGNNQSQKVPVKAAALNIKGIIALDLSKPEEAKNLFNDALKVFPEFALAKGNLQSVEGKK